MDEDVVDIQVPEPTSELLEIDFQVPEPIPEPLETASTSKIVDIEVDEVDSINGRRKRLSLYRMSDAQKKRCKIIRHNRKKETGSASKCGRYYI